jgi:hypothetical protein
MTNQPIHKKYHRIVPEGEQVQKIAISAQFAHALLTKCDELDKINEERYEQ